jgi:methyltransferase (TIGR00027 family)
MRLTPLELHRSDRPSSTAEATTLARAAELRRRPQRRIVSDDYAPHFLSPAGRAALRSMRVGRPVFGAIERTELGGPLTFALCRHRFIDGHFVQALTDGVDQVVILGAGYDSRAYRFAGALEGRPVHEVDLAPLSRRKASIIAANPEVFGPTTVRRVEIDFRVHSLAERLLECGFAVGARTFVVWEGVSMYLSPDAVDRTLAELHDLCGRGSRIAVDFWQELPGGTPIARTRRAITRSFALIGEPLTFAATPDAVGRLMRSHGFAVEDLADAEELTRRHSTARRPCERSTFVLTARRS